MWDSDSPCWWAMPVVYCVLVCVCAYVLSCTPCTACVQRSSSDKTVDAPKLSPSFWRVGNLLIELLEAVTLELYNSSISQKIRVRISLCLSELIKCQCPNVTECYHFNYQNIKILVCQVSSINVCNKYLFCALCEPGITFWSLDKGESKTGKTLDFKKFAKSVRI